MESKLTGNVRLKIVKILIRLLFSLKSKEMAKMRLLVIWIDQRYSFLKNGEKKL